MPFRGQNHRAMNGKLSGGCKVWIRACSRPRRSSGATVSDTGIDTQSQKFSFCARYRKESSADTSLSSMTCLYLRYRVCSLAIAFFSVLPT